MEMRFLLRIIFQETRSVEAENPLVYLTTSALPLLKSAIPFPSSSSDKTMLPQTSADGLTLSILKAVEI